MPLILSGANVWTFQDAVDYVLDSHEIVSDPLNRRRARAAVVMAYRNIVDSHDWNYFYRQRILNTVASYSTGTVVYDHTGGANERQLTLTTGTWPSWAAFGKVIISNVHYEVSTRVSDSIVTLTSNSNPGQDVASTTYQIYRSSYPLPSDFRRLAKIWDVTQQREVNYVNAIEQHTAVNIFYDVPADPWHYTIRADGKYYGSFSLMFGPPPSAIRQYDMLYKVAPRQLNFNNDYSSGTVSCSASTSVTGSSTTFPTGCSGSIIRFSSNNTPPTGIIGSYDGNDNPFIAQAVISSRGSATALTLSEAITETLSGVGYTISDPLDLEEGSMLSAFLKMAEAEFASRAGRKDAAMKAAEARRALIMGIEADNLKENTSTHLAYDPIDHSTESTSS